MARMSTRKQDSITGTDRDVGFITQQDNLFSWRTLLDNVALALEIAGAGAAERKRSPRFALAAEISGRTRGSVVRL